MAKPKSPVQRFSMMWSPGQTTSLGYWPPELETNGTGWAPQSFQVHRETLAIAKKYSDQNELLFAAQQANSAPPDLGDLVTRRQRAMADYRRLAELGNKLSTIDKQVTQKQSQLKAFDYSNDSIRDAMLRQERRSHMRNNMSEEERKNALRDYEWRKAALETDASLSGIAPTFHKAIEDETLKMRYGAELQGIGEARAAIEAVSTAMDAAAKALEHELKVTETAVPGAPPAETPAWVKED